MNRPSTPQTQLLQRDPDLVARLGGWLFRHRSWIPLPLALALIFIPAPDAPSSLIWTGAGVIGVGEALRLWAVRHIGVVSRTRIDRSGPLVSTGPFSYVRNPLYLANVALWAGFAMAARLVWLTPLLVLLLAFEYHAIVRWEETLLESRLGQPYREYAARVPRWLPSLTRSLPGAPSAFSWSDTLFSERGTLLAIAVGGVLLWIKSSL